MNRILLDNNQTIYEGDNSVVVKDSNEKVDITICNNTTCTIFISNLSKLIELKIKENKTVKINIIAKETNNDITYYLNENTNIIVNKLAINNNDTITVNLNNQYSSIIYNYSAIDYKESNYKITVKHNAKKTSSNIYNHALSVTDKKITFDINGYVYKDSSKCICNQDNKIIHIKENTSKINPNLFIENYDVEANHSAYIGTFKKKDLFYLMTRGIKEEDCYRLFRKSFILGKMVLNKEEEEFFEKELENII